MMGGGGVPLVFVYNSVNGYLSKVSECVRHGK